MSYYKTRTMNEVLRGRSVMDRFECKPIAPINTRNYSASSTIKPPPTFSKPPTPTPPPPYRPIVSSSVPVVNPYPKTAPIAVSERTPVSTTSSGSSAHTTSSAGHGFSSSFSKTPTESTVNIKFSEETVEGKSGILRNTPSHVIVGAAEGAAMGALRLGPAGVIPGAISGGIESAITGSAGPISYAWGLK